MPPEESWETETLPAQLKELCVAGGGGGVLGVHFRWDGTFGLSERPPHLSLFCGQIIVPVLVTFQ